MSQNPQKRNKDSKKAAEGSIEQSIDNEDGKAEFLEVTCRGDKATGMTATGL
jgi:translation elongation factor EF-Ts